MSSISDVSANVSATWSSDRLPFSSKVALPGTKRISGVDSKTCATSAGLPVWIETTVLTPAGIWTGSLSTCVIEIREGSTPRSVRKVVSD